jgi:glutamine kinase
MEANRMSLVFATKAGTLLKLQGILKTAQIAPLIFFTVKEWQQNSTKCLAGIEDKLGPGPWIVRSSCGREDSSNESNAGAFLSLLDIDKFSLNDAVNEVIASYGENVSSDEVLVQPMLQAVVHSGVAFSHDPNTCAPYRIVNWSDGEDTAAVTGGLGGRIWQQAASSKASAPQEIMPVIGLLDELLVLFADTPVDCEYAVTEENGTKILWLLQARPLVLIGTPESTNVQTDRLQKIYDKVVRGMGPHPLLMGQQTVYGVMPDWNPAEIIGVRPKPLALSLYRELITDATWAYQRHNYGYRNLRSFPLMPHFFGLPYIDVRLSFNSFIPADLDDGLAGRLVDYYVEQLVNQPSLHDKVEFEIVFSCYTLDLPERLERLEEAGFSKSEIETITNSLRNLTNRIVHPDEGLWREDAAKLDTLNARRESLMSSSADRLERIYWLIEDAKRYGTLPFAGLARAAFIAVQMLKSLVAVGVLSQDDYDAFIESVSTVSGQLALNRVTLDQPTFLGIYGHLRPGTYDILSPRYDEAPEMYFDWDNRPPVPNSVKPFSLTLPQMREMVKLLNSHGLEPDPVGLFDFMQEGIELREFAKFNFSRNLSDAMSLMVEVVAQYGISREDLSYCDIAIFQELHIGASDPEYLLCKSIEQGKARYAETLKVALPPLITQPEDVWGFEWPETDPNFITQKQITASVVSSEDKNHVAGAIVCIPNADPGFDWLFSYPIAGLITAWGGVNSHMAIRAGELGLPSVIGVGELLYKKWSTAKRLHLDCAGRRVEVLE